MQIVLKVLIYLILSVFILSIKSHFQTLMYLRIKSKLSTYKLYIYTLCLYFKASYPPIKYRSADYNIHLVKSNQITFNYIHSEAACNLPGKITSSFSYHYHKCNGVKSTLFASKMKQKYEGAVKGNT